MTPEKPGWHGFWADSEAWADEGWPDADALSDAPPPPDDGGLIQLRDSGLVDAPHYADTVADLDGAEPALHYLTAGAAAGAMPNFYFDTAWYLAQNPDVARAGVNPLLHYITAGEAEGRAPCLWFDLAWYATQHRPAPGETFLAHFLARRGGGEVSPMADFDAAFYLAANPDVASAGVDPAEHFLRWGFREGRCPSPGFDTRYYIRRHLGGRLDENPLLHHRRIRHLIDLPVRPGEGEDGVFEQAARATRPGALFEEQAPLPASVPRRAMALAFYLPQFHAIAENDRWWGTGFTEWTSIARGLPRFDGHLQPRVPRDLGHYTLADPTVMHRQAALARAAGLAGFVHYFYWFNGHRLLESPIEAMLADPTLDFPFCLMWANENWTRRWDGSDDEVLIAQDWREEDEPALIACLLRHFADARYIRLGGRPLLMIYRPGIIPDTRATVARWRARFREVGEDPILVMSQSFNATDPRDYGFDAAVEFPPHKVVLGVKPVTDALRWFDTAASMQVFAYEDIVRASLAEPPPEFPLIKTAVPGWDNDARRQGKGLALHGATPAGYQAWLGALVEHARAHPVQGEAIVCVNAWNEWAEGATLEPCVHFGSAFLNATARAIGGMDGMARRGVLLVGHDAFPAGAQMLLLNLARTLRTRNGVTLEIVLLGDGALRADYAAVAPTLVMTAEALAGHARGLAARGITAAIVNSAAAAGAVAPLTAAGIPATLLVHELPRIIAQGGLAAGLRAGVAAARETIYPAPAVQAATGALAPPAAMRIMPQGCYRPAPFDAGARSRLRAELGVAPGQPLVLGAGYGDMRKGFDLFLQAWRAARRRASKVVFCWIGAVDATLASHLAVEIEEACATGRFILPGRQDDPAPWYSAADVFALTSREDPFPSVVLEALSAGLPSVAFAGSGGIPDLLAEESCGEAVAMGDAAALARAALALAGTSEAGRARLAAIAARRFDFATYASALLRTAHPGLPRISVVVPSFNYARYLPTRLASIFAQTHPVEEVILLDDASTDDSVAVAARVAAQWGRTLRIVANARNSGSVFRQWKRGAELARGDFVWIAEADDDADPGFLTTLAGRLEAAPDADMLASDSQAIDGAGGIIRADHQAYYASMQASALARDGVFGARDFARRFMAERNVLLNASAVLFRARPLRAALKRCAVELGELRVAGDWRVYLEVLAASQGSLCWTAAPLNRHRRHDDSVTSRLDPERHLDEIRRVHAAARQVLDSTSAERARQDAYLRRVARDLGVAFAAAPAVGLSAAAD